MPKYEVQVQVPQVNRENYPRGPTGPPEVDDEEANATLLFEMNSIKKLQDERVYIQEKTFTKWCNSFLSQARLEITNLFSDLGDGILLMKLLEIISGEKLGKPNRGKLRVQKVENLNKSLDFLKRKRIQLENIGAEDILDGNERLILGLIWTIILRFQIDTISLPMDEETGERKYAKEALLLWCQRKTADYPNVKVENFTTSWRNGLAFNALIHAHRPDLISFDSLSGQDPIGNLNNAFDIAEKKLEIPRLLDAEDVNVNHPDEKSIITYVSLFYHCFAKQKTELTGARRVAKIVGNLMSVDQLQEEYETLCSELLEWIRQTVVALNDRRFPNSLAGMKEEVARFNAYRTVEKPPKYKEKGDLEALFFTIQTKRKAMKRSPYVPPQGLLMHDIETEWNVLDHAESERQSALIAEAARQERLENIAKKFERKAELRESWLKDMGAVLSDFDFGRTAGEVEASMKKQQAITAEILPREVRFKSLSKMAADLAKEKYHNSDKIRARDKEILDKWTQLLANLEARRVALMSLNDLMGLLRDIDTLSSEIQRLQPQFLNRDVGRHLLGVEDLLEKHEILEAQLNSQGELLKNITAGALQYIRGKGEQYDVLQRKLDDVSNLYNSVADLCRQRRLALLRARDLYRFIQDYEEEMSWLKEKNDVCSSLLANHDLSVTPQLSRLFKHLETEMHGHWQRTKTVIAIGERLMANGQNKDDIEGRIQQLYEKWEQLRKAAEAVAKWLHEAEAAHQYFQDANEAESWIREKMPLVKSDDYGRDEQASANLLQRHARLEEEIQAYRSDIIRLEEMADELAKSDFVVGTAVQVIQDTTELKVPQVRMLYPFKGNNVSVKKDEILALIEKSNEDWWRILKQDGTEGYIPANYCKIVDGETVTVSQTTTVRKPEARDSANKSHNIVTERQEAISADYRKLNNLAQRRRKLLSDMVSFYKFLRECDQFETWANEAKSAFADDITSEDVHALRKKFDKIDRDIATSGKAQLKRINTMADELLAEGHSHSPEITRHQDTVNRLWNDLNKLRDAKLAQLETAERVSSFNEACEDARSWMRDKFDLLNTSADTSDPNASRALQRRYQNLGKDLKPLDEKIRGLRKLANEVRMEHPEEAKRIDATIKELEALHADLQRNAAAKIEEAEQSQGTQMFDNAAKALLNWAAKTKAQLTETPKPVNVASAEELLKRHYELSDDIASKKYEFDYVRDLGQRLLQKNPSLAKVKGILRDLEEERQKINGMWKDKERVLKEMLDLQLFNTEAERIDAATKGHEDFLKLSNLGDSVESVENLLKRHSDFEAKLKAQEDRLRAFSNTAEQLISAGHSDSSYIKERQTNVLNRRRAVHSAAASRRAQLEASLIYQKLRQNVTELSQWIADKKRIANDDAHKDIASLHLKRLKHDAFEAELKANAERIEQVNQEGKALIASGHYESPAIKQLLSKLNSDWDDLCRAADAKRQRLDQAGDQKNLNAAIDDVHQKLDEVSNSLTSKDLGNDLRGVKTLLKKQDILEQEMTQIQQKITELSRRGDAMARQGHFDAPNIQKVVTKLQDKFESWKRPVCDRRVALEESLKWHKLSFDIDCEMQWIAEKESFASSIETGQSLTDTLNLQKKHEQLEAEVNSHSAQIHSTLKEGDALIKQKHFAADAIEQKCEKLRVAWDHLNELIRQRKDLLDWALKEKQYMFDAAEIESWLQDKRLLLSSNDYGQDEDAAQKLLTKHKALQTDMAAYKQWLEKLSVKCGDLTKSASPSDRDKFLKRQKELEDEFDAINKLAEDRRRQLENAVLFYQYMRESEELESWINEQLQMAISEDYGEDYEHLKELQARFEEFKEGVKTGTQRFVHCENAANALLKRNPPFARDILKRQEKLRSVWNLLLDYIESRDEKLKAAEELHAFNRDVAEKQERIAEMHSSIPSELGKDIKQVHALWLKHEAFENQLGAMEGELDKLMEESARLKLAYPGGNAEHITLQQTAISDGWHDLQDATIVRRDLLKASYDLQRFYVNARDLIAWADVMITDMHSEPVVHDLQGAEWLKKDHERLRAEIDSREPEFLRISELGQQMIDKDHYAKADIAVKIKQVLAALDRVHKEWENRRNWLSEICEWHAFQREAKQTLASIAARRKTLRLTQVGESVEEVENQLRKLDTFQKALSGIDDRVAALEKSGADLIGKKHMNSDQIKELLNKVKTELVELRNGMNDRRLELMDALKLAKFNSSVADMDGWIEEKIKRIRMETDKQAKLTSIEDKMRRLQKHQAMEAELEANAPRVEEIRQMLKERASLPGVNRAEVVKKSEEVLSRWEKLTSMSRDQSSALEEARDLLNFNQMVERIMQWIKEKELLVSAGDMGRDMEHCQMLMDKLQGKDADASVDDSTVQAANDLGRKLISQGRSSQKDVQDQLTNLNKAWKDLKGKLNAYRSQLNAAIEVHAFNRDVDDTIDRINEKVSLVANDDVGKDLPTVEALIRKQEAVKRDMTVIHDKLKIHDEEAQKLLKKDVPLRDTMVESLRKLEASWRKLAEMAADRDAALARSLELQRYFDATRKADTWANEMRDSLLATETAPTTSGVEELIAKHKDKLAEIDGRQKDTADFHEWGNKLIAEQPEHKIIVQKTLKRLQIIEHQLRQAWETKNTSLSRQRDLQQFTDQADRVEQWLATKEAFLKQADVGDSVEAANEHLKKHDDFEKSLLAQSEKIDNLKKEADHLAKKDAEHSHEIQQRKDAVVARYNAVIEACKNRRLHLIESRKLHEFIDSCGDLMQWISANIQLAYDETFLDQTNLRSKLRKHLAFEAELDANEERVRTIIDAGEKLIAEKHSASEDIALQIEEVKKGWQELRSKSAMKKQRLREANEAYQLNRRLEDLEKWVERVENDLSSEDHGKDLVSVEAIIKKQDDLEAEIKSRQDIVKETVEKAREFEKQGYASSKESLELAQNLESRYFGLKEPCQIRRDNLEDARKLYEWMTEAEEQFEWISDKLQIMRNTHYGDTLHEVQSLMKKQALFEEEISDHEVSIAKVEDKGSNMVKLRHFASDQIQARLEELSSKFLKLKQLTAERSAKLQDSLKSQKYYAEASEAEYWMKERLPLVSSHESVKDQGSAEIQLRKLTGLEKDIEKFSKEIDKLRNQVDEMVAYGHFDANQLTSKQMKLEQMYKELRDACSKRRIQLVDDIRYHSFVRQVDDLSQWLEEKAEIAKQDNYGRDLEDCQCLVGEFDQVMKQLTSAGERVAAVQRCQEELLRNGHPYSASIRAKGTDLQQLWVSVNETANERQQALQGAIQVHKFDQDADETLGWLEEKEAHQVAMEGEDMTHADLPTLKQLMIKHDEFMHGVAAVEKQVTDLSKEAERLVTAYPDTKSHLEVRRIQMEEQLKDVTIASRKHLEKLDQMQNLQSYFQEHRDLIAWIRRLQHTITSEVLPLSVEGCEALMLRHNEYQTEISGRQAQIDEFIRKGRSMIASQHVLSVEISAKIDQLIKAYNTLKSTWNERSALYQENHDLRLWQHDADKLDGWLTEKECMLSEEWRKVENVEDAESRIRNFDDFLITLDAQEPKFEALKRLTLLEKAFSAQRKTETERLDAAKEAKRRETIKTFEKTNKLQDRRKERERRMTQEVSLLKPNPSFEDASEYSTQVVSQSRRVTAPVPPLRSSFDSRESAGIATPTTASHLDIRGTEGGMKTPQSVVSVVSGEEVLQRDGSARRTPRFTTRRSNSLRKLAVEDETGSVDMYGYLDRKHDLQTGGKKATVRTWKRFYTILCGQLLCFFKDENAFRENSASSAPVNILNAECNICPEYLKKKNTFRLKVQDGSEYLFSCTEEKIMLEWIDKIRFHAALTPSQQLRSFDQGENPPCRAPPPRPTDIGRRHTTEVAASSPVRSHSTSDPVSPTQESSSAQADEIRINGIEKGYASPTTRPHSCSVGAQNTHDSVETKVKLPSSESMRNRDSGSVSPLRYANRNDGTDFIAWVESQGNLSTSSTVSSSQNDDTGESVKGKKSKFSLFKWGSKKESK